MLNTHFSVCPKHLKIQNINYFYSHFNCRNCEEILKEKHDLKLVA